VPQDTRDAALSAVEVFCESRIAQELRNEIRLECSRRGNAITIVERRPPWNPEMIGDEWTTMKIAQLRHDPTSKTWSLYCRDGNDRWWPYDNIAPSASVDALLAELDTDPTGIFWG
jgi:Protein of unknown function (DUF3024)